MSSLKATSNTKWIKAEWLLEVSSHSTPMLQPRLTMMNGTVILDLVCFEKLETD